LLGWSVVKLTGEEDTEVRIQLAVVDEVRVHQLANRLLRQHHLQHIVQVRSLGEQVAEHQSSLLVRGEFFLRREESPDGLEPVEFRTLSNAERERCVLRAHHHNVVVTGVEQVERGVLAVLLLITLKGLVCGSPLGLGQLEELRRSRSVDEHVVLLHLERTLQLLVVQGASFQHSRLETEQQRVAATDGLGRPRYLLKEVVVMTEDGCHEDDVSRRCSLLLGEHHRHHAQFLERFLPHIQRDRVRRPLV